MDLTDPSGSAANTNTAPAPAPADMLLSFDFGGDSKPLRAKPVLTKKYYSKAERERMAEMTGTAPAGPAPVPAPVRRLPRPQPVPDGAAFALPPSAGPVTASLVAAPSVDLGLGGGDGGAFGGGAGAGGAGAGGAGAGGAGAGGDGGGAGSGGFSSGLVGMLGGGSGTGGSGNGPGPGAPLSPDPMDFSAAVAALSVKSNDRQPRPASGFFSLSTGAPDPAPSQPSSFTQSPDMSPSPAAFERQPSLRAEAPIWPAEPTSTTTISSSAFLPSSGGYPAGEPSFSASPRRATADAPAHPQPASPRPGFRPHSEPPGSFSLVAPHTSAPQSPASRALATGPGSTGELTPAEREELEKLRFEVRLLKDEVAELDERWRAERQRRLALESSQPAGGSTPSLESAVAEIRRLTTALRTCESTCHQLRERSEYLALVTETMKKNEDILRNSALGLQEQLQHANVELDRLRSEHHREVGAAKARLALETAQVRSLQSTLELRERENTELFGICDELIKKLDSVP
ncbi:hypothetical protein H696_00265 [Fonticula alba]|uniref:Transforming acidic coiled-coil-containing protein C-terminal domain-containing protein n=1 Tax=Fonticula alba TaxID=691883 RepID=A0A058ZFF6_FONAL|nr:hypothetical protein H696_00265 [Fonticula alba]KCV72686.1 hypothetical protein H696_00265 [Fonticula alba]|eukprot:XP_009492387.1 hypothetical protein H696_00265 [Fonticula alba]